MFMGSASSMSGLPSRAFRELSRDRAAFFAGRNSTKPDASSGNSLTAPCSAVFYRASDVLLILAVRADAARYQWTPAHAVRSDTHPPQAHDDDTAHARVLSAARAADRARTHSHRSCSAADHRTP